MGQKISSELLCRRPPELRVLICGLDAAGKTSILYRLKTGDLIATIPTIGFNVETVAVEGRAKLTMWDMGGRDKLRALQRHYFPNTHGLCYIVDGVDRERLSETVDELKSLLHSLEVEDVGDIPVAILCNKSDLEPETVMKTFEELRHLTRTDLASRRRACRCFVVSAATGDGLSEAIEWLIGQALHELPVEAADAAQVADAEDGALDVAGTEKAGSSWTSSLYSLVKSVMLR